MKKHLILAVDIGNTSAVCALCRGGQIGKMHRIPSLARSRDDVAGFLESIAGKASLAGSVLCSVVPGLNSIWRAELVRLTGVEPVMVGCDIALGIGIDYKKPGQIGADRLANAVGAVKMFGIPSVVLDFGTAVTVDVVSRAGAYSGGVIMPGLSLMADYFNDRTALLPRLDFFKKRPGQLPGIGRSTEEAMYIGALKGFQGMLKNVVKGVKKELGPGRINICATGGHASVILKDAGLDVPVDPKLTLRGLCEIFALNRRDVL